MKKKQDDSDSNQSTQSSSPLESIKKYVKHMPKIMPRQRMALEYIFNYIQHIDLPTAQLKERLLINPVQTEIKPQDAVLRFQRTIRCKQFADLSHLHVNHFFSTNSSRQTYLSLLNQQYVKKETTEIPTLAKIMFGKTIAGVVANFDFPSKRSEDWSWGRYHRDDQMSGKLYDVIINHYEPDKNNDEEYIPFINVKNASIDNLLNNYLNRNEKLLIKEIFIENNARIGMIALHSVNLKKGLIEKLKVGGLISPELEEANNNYEDNIICIMKNGKNSTEDLIKPHLSNEELQLIKECKNLTYYNVIFLHENKKEETRNNLINKIRSAGLLPSPWEIAQFNVKLEHYHGNNSSNQPNKIFENIDLNHLSNSVKTLKNSELMIELSKIAVSPSPCKLLAACLHRMISALPNNFDNKEIIQRISLFLSFGVNNYSKNYGRFAYIVYAVTHELSLFIKDAMNHGIKITDYDQFKLTMEKRANSSLNLSHENQVNCTLIAAPAMSGTHAFMIALNLAKQVIKKPGHKLTIQVVRPLYFEFHKYVPLKKHSDNKNLADIYHITAGPVVSNEKGLIPGTDINKFIRNMLLKYPIDKPIIILIDVTSALYKNLRLDEEIKQWIAQKNISIICHESYQKFGLAHTDQVQAGAVYGLCHNESFTPAIINQFDENSRYDFENNLDMIVAQFIHQHCGDYLERIKENHFKNGSLFKHFFESKSIYSDPENNINHIHQYDEMLTNLNELYFFVTKPGTIDTSEEYQLNFAPHGCLATRDSFGHFSSCQLFIRSSKSYSNFSRVSPNASDPFDTIIDMIAICLFSKFDKTNELFDLLNSILLSRKSIQESFSREEEIFLAGLLVGLTRYYLKFDICSQVPLLLRGINHLIYNASDYLIGRNAYYLLKDTLSNKQTLFKADQIAVFVDETIQIEQERSIVLS